MNANHCEKMQHKVRSRLIEYSMTLTALLTGYTVYCKIAEAFFDLLVYHQHGARYYVSPDRFGSGHAVVPLVPMIERLDVLATWGLLHVGVCALWLLALVTTDVARLIFRQSSRRVVEKDHV